jgi:hypothetical protein
VLSSTRWIESFCSGGRVGRKFCELKAKLERDRSMLAVAKMETARPRAAGRGRPGSNPLRIVLGSVWIESFCRGGRVGCNSEVPAGGTPAATGKSRSIDYHDFALIRPICSVIHQSCSNRILSYVIPLFAVTFAAPKYVIEESRLPEPLLLHGYRHRF